METNAFRNSSFLKLQAAIQTPWKIICVNVFQECQLQFKQAETEKKRQALLSKKQSREEKQQLQAQLTEETARRAEQEGQKGNCMDGLRSG